ncbi:MAG: hypothetical protein SOZ58_07250 [Prevotella sp.]|nr:hypothetical protein [Prevotella sp.]
MKQLVQILPKANNILPIYNMGLFICCLSYLFISCRDAAEIVLYYKTGYIASPISKSIESFEDEMSNHPIDTVIYIRTEEFQRYYRILHSIEYQEGNIDNIHDYFIGIKCDGVNLAIQLPIPDSLNEEIITYTKQRHHGTIKDRDLYELLCTARYFDFFSEEELVDNPMVKKYHVPSDYKCFWGDDASDIPLRLKSRYKVIIRAE